MIISPSMSLIPRQSEQRLLLSLLQPSDVGSYLPRNLSIDKMAVFVVIWVYGIVYRHPVLAYVNDDAEVTLCMPNDSRDDEVAKEVV